MLCCRLDLNHLKIIFILSKEEKKYFLSLLFKLHVTVMKETDLVSRRRLPDIRQLPAGPYYYPTGTFLRQVLSVICSPEA